MTTVSVVIPSRGRPDRVAQAVRSALAQSVSDIEVIVVVDGPDAATEAALAGIDDPRLRRLVNPRSLGGGAARNEGVQAATADWIAFLDDDDEWLPTKLERQLAAIAEARVAQPIAFCPIVVRGPDGDTAWRNRPPDEGEPASEYLFVRRSLRVGEGTVGTSTILAPRSLLLDVPFDPTVRRFQDADWILRATARGAQLVYCPERLSVWAAPGPGGSITGAHAGEWRQAFDWIRQRRELVTTRAYAAFLLVRVAALAAEAGDRAAIGAIWREARRSGRPAVIDVVLFAARWVVPGGLRRGLRRRLAGVRQAPVPAMTGSPRPRVLLLVENLPVPLDRRAWQEARALHAAGWDVTVICPRGAGEMGRLRQRLEGILVLRYPQRAARGLAGYLVEYVPSMLFTAAWALYARRHGPFDVVHGCNPPDLFWLFGKVAGLEGGRFVFDQHDVGPELALTKWGRDGGIRARLLDLLSGWLERRSYATAALVLVPNDSYRAIAVDRGKVGPERVLVVRNAPDIERYRSLAAGVEIDPHRVGYVGVMGSQDGLDMLLDAWATVVREPDMADAVLELVGDGEARPALEARAATLGIAGQVRFHGYRSAAEFVPVLAACAIGVCPDPPTPFNDVSTMVKVVDYLAIGRGIVAFDLQETRLAAGDAVHIVNDATPSGLAAGMLAVLRDPALRDRLGAAGAGRVAALELDWSRSATILIEGYAGLLSGPPPPPRSEDGTVS